MSFLIMFHCLKQWNMIRNGTRPAKVYASELREEMAMGGAVTSGCGGAIVGASTNPWSAHPVASHRGRLGGSGEMMGVVLSPYWQVSLSPACFIVSNCHTVLYDFKKQEM